MNPKTGQALWIALHAHAWNLPAHPSAGLQRAAREWLATWARGLPQGGCPCSSAWRIMVDHCPPPLASRDDYYWWTVAAHDRVNHKLGKPLMAAAWSTAHPVFTRTLTLF